MRRTDSLSRAVDESAPHVRRGNWSIVFDDVSRLSWTQVESGIWRLNSMWPTRRQRAQILRHARSGRPILIVTRATAERQTAFHSEIPFELRPFVQDIGSGLGEVAVITGDWLPRTLRQELEVFLRFRLDSAAGAPALLRSQATLRRLSKQKVYCLVVDSSVRRADIEDGLEVMIEFIERSETDGSYRSAGAAPRERQP